MDLIDQEHRPETIEKVKQNSLNRQKEGSDHWHEELASDSESAVRPIRIHPRSQSVYAYTKSSLGFV